MSDKHCEEHEFDYSTDTCPACKEVEKAWNAYELCRDKSREKDKRIAELKESLAENVCGYCWSKNIDKNPCDYKQATKENTKLRECLKGCWEAITCALIILMDFQKGLKYVKLPIERIQKIKDKATKLLGENK